jgi:N-acetylmuramoyl-L-alanine amidase
LYSSCVANLDGVDWHLVFYGNYFMSHSKQKCSIVAVILLLGFAWVAQGQAAEIYRSRLSADEIFRRTQAVLAHFGVEQGSDSSLVFNDLQGKVSADDIRMALPSMDLKSTFSSFSDLDHRKSSFNVFQDLESKSRLDYTVALNSSDRNSQGRRPFEKNLARAATQNPANQPLLGLKIALDPGHMGTKRWDDLAEKYTNDHKGHWLSEGELNLQMAIMLEQELMRLGATVMITRSEYAPVTNVNYSTFDVHERGLRALRESTLDPWFQQLIESSPPGPALYSAFERSPQFRKVFSESNRREYFIGGYDLEARSEMINRFSPDFTLILHLDGGTAANGGDGLNSGHDGTKAYVPGAFTPSELSSREDRMYFGRHLLDKRTRDTSIELAKSIVDQIHDQLKIPYDSIYPGHSVAVAPGVQARNLELQRKLISHPSAYIEGLYYSCPAEFYALLQTHHRLVRNGRDVLIGGKPVMVSDRLIQLVGAIRDGVVSFVGKRSDN